MQTGPRCGYSRPSPFPAQTHVPSRPKRTPADRTTLLLQEWGTQRPGESLEVQSARTQLLLLGTCIARDNDSVARLLGVTGAELRVLLALRRRGSPYRMRPADLLDALLVPSSSMTRQLDQLESRGLVQRCTDPEDGRGKLVQLTAEGVAIANRAIPRMLKQSVVSRALLEMDPRKVETLNALLRDLLTRLPHD